MHLLPNHRLATLVVALVMFTLPQHASAGTYWWSGAPAAGSNGFAFSSADQPWWNPWGGTGRCESRGATIPAGNPCVLSWTVPAGLDARGGSIGGTYKQANPAFEQHNVVECNGTTVLQGTATPQAFQRAWPDMCGFVNIWLFTPSSATAVSAASQYFEATSFSIELVDPHLPALEVSTGHEGWKGAGGACVRYGYSDLGSGIESTSLVDVTSGRTVDAASWASGAIVTGVTRTDRTPCMAAPGTGTYTLRASAVDKSGNRAQHDLQVSFDVTGPALGAPQVDGTTVGNGVELRGSRDGYRPTIDVAASDAHSGLARVQLLLDGDVVVEGSSWRPDSDLAPGAHTITARAFDAVGNVSTTSRTITVVDDVPPVMDVTSPGATGGSEPVLDIEATDDLTGLDPTSWTVRVNGELLVASSDTSRLQAAIGTLADGTHQLEVSIADRAGNVATSTPTYVADSGDELPDAPALDGLHLLQSPSRVEEGATHRVLAVAVRRGRPVVGRFELRHGAGVVAHADSTASGIVELAATITVAGPLRLHAPAGSGLEPAIVDYTFVPAPTGGEDVDDDTDGGSGGGSTTIINLPGATGGGTGATQPAGVDARSPWPTNVVYYVHGVPHWNGLPLAESGAPLDRVAPTWRLSLRHERAGVVRRTGRIALRLWTSEMSVLSIAPTGSSRRISVNPRRRLRTIHVRYDRRSLLGTRIARARAGGVVVVRMRVVATDRNENSSRPRTLTFRVRV